jgi:hypothetical protein
MKSTTIWVVTTYNPVVQHFGGTYCRQPQGQRRQRVGQASIQQEAGGLDFEFEDGGSVFLRSVGEILTILPDYTALRPRR